jgi:hypothetical protein
MPLSIHSARGPVLWAGHPASNQNPKTKKPGCRPGFVVDTHETRATAYPAECRTSGRRARDVMPAAMRALVSTVAV